LPTPEDPSAARERDRVAQPAERVREAECVDPHAPLHIVLVEPKIPPNTGNVARLCAATGCVLHLVEPLGFSIDDRELKRAGLDYWHNVDVRVHASLDAFLSAWQSPLWLLSTRATNAYADAAFATGDAIVFGSETAGLPQALLDERPERALRVPMRHDSVRSLNLSTTVGIVTYAALAKLGFPGLG
jgi:tRNA (cytidine/uridine-2'-O-)-methyltransferase